MADIVAKVFLGWRRKILRAADAFYARRRGLDVPSTLLSPTS
jgi:hypothetical protein